MNGESLNIFVTRIVGRAMGSGKFDVADIEPLTQAALLAYNTHLAPLEGRPAPGASQSAPRPPAPPGFQFVRPVATEALAEEPFRAPASGQADGKPYALWQHDKIGIGKKPSPINGKTWNEVTWAEAHRLAAAGNAQTTSYLSWIAEKLEVEPGKWEKLGNARKARAACVLAMAKAGQAAPQEAEETPF